MTRYSTTVTFDWDSTRRSPFGIREAKVRFSLFTRIERPLKASLMASPLKGFHVRAEFDHLVDNWKMRDKWKDDGKRLVHEILGHPDGVKVIHNTGVQEFFWNGKAVLLNKSGKCVLFDETPIEAYP